MARSELDYKNLLLSLLPKGRLWNKNEDTYLSKLMHGLAYEFVRIDERAKDLFDEKDTRTTSELLEEHETDFGIPELGTELGITTEQRQEVLNSALLRIGQQYKEYFEERALALGYTINITEFYPFWAGYSKAGDACGDQQNLFYWKIGIDVDSVTESYEVNLSTIITTLGKEKPLHTICLFDFYDAEFDRGFSRAFRRFPSYDNSWIELDFGREFSSDFANAFDYDGINYVGSYESAFDLSFDRYSGGEFFVDEFSSDFRRTT